MEKKDKTDYTDNKIPLSKDHETTVEMSPEKANDDKNKVDKAENKNAETAETKKEKLGIVKTFIAKLPGSPWNYVWIILNTAIIIFVVYKIATLYIDRNDSIPSTSENDETPNKSIDENDFYTFNNGKVSLTFENIVKDSLDLYDKLVIKNKDIIQRTIEGTYNNDSIYCIMPLLDHGGNILIITFKKNTDGKKVYDLRILNDIDDKIIIENVSLKNIRKDSTKLKINYFNNKTDRNEKKEFAISQ